MASPVEAILSAVDSHGALGLSRGEPISPPRLRSAFRRRALLCHPDKSTHPRAQEAFRILTDAFEALEEGGERRWQGEGVPSASSEPRAKRQRRRHTERSWKDWERELQRREAVERELQRSFHKLQSDKYASRRASAALRKACNVCEELDERAGITENELIDGWAGVDGESASSPPPCLSLEESTAAASAAVDPQRLLHVLSYLRSTHLYCLFCGIRFRSDEDMESGCPGMTEEAHEDGDVGKGEDGDWDDFD
ncbi:MAG: hypothetical protein SGPRY_009815 [Prymnesium sp.]